MVPSGCVTHTACCSNNPSQPGWLLGCRVPVRCAAISLFVVRFSAQPSVRITIVLGVVACSDGAREREYRVARKFICRKGECGYEVGVGGWKLMRTRAEALRDHWSSDVAPDIRSEADRLAAVAEAHLQKVPFTAATTVNDVILPVRPTGQLDERPPSSVSKTARASGTTMRSSSAAAHAGAAILSATLAELSGITSRGTRTVGEQVSVESSVSSAFTGTSVEGKATRTTASTRGSRKSAQQHVSIDAQIAAAEGEVVSAVMAVEACLRTIKPAAVEGARVFGLSIAVEAKQTAFTPLTQALRAHRERVIQLCDAVNKWQTLKVSKAKRMLEHAKKSAVLPSLSRTLSPTTSGSGTPTSASTTDLCAGLGRDADGNIDVSKVSTEPPPFIWNGENVLVKLSGVLDYLGQLPELREWYSDTYVFTCNPLSMHCGLSDRPDTPVTTTRRVRCPCSHFV
jgi:hypothetical protein